MKLIQILILMLLAGLIAQSDPYGFLELSSQRQQKKTIIIDTLTTNTEGKGFTFSIEFIKGKAHNHPLFAIWAEDTSGNYIQTLYVSKAIATSIFNYGDNSQGAWTEGVVRRPAALPYWSHKRGVVAADGLYLPTPENPVPDAYSGATPQGNYIVNTRLDIPGPDIFYILLELNQPWDWNKYWTNNRYPDNEEYKASSQPAVVYRAMVNIHSDRKELSMKVIGHSHYSGKDGSLTEDVSTLTTALEIADEIVIILPE